MDHLFVRSIVTEQVRLRPAEMGSNFRDVLLHKVRTASEGRCTRNGYVRPGSVQLHMVSAGCVDAASLNGDVVFNVMVQSDICNPAEGAQVLATAINVNRFGILAHSFIQDADTGVRTPVLNIIIARAGVSVQSSVPLDDVRIGDTLRVEILRCKYELNDARIGIVGRVVAHDHLVGSAVLPPGLGPAAGRAPQYIDELGDGAALDGVGGELDADADAAAAADAEVLDDAHVSDDEGEDEDEEEDDDGEGVPPRGKQQRKKKRDAAAKQLLQKKTKKAAVVGSDSEGLGDDEEEEEEDDDEDEDEEEDEEEEAVVVAAKGAVGPAGARGASVRSPAVAAGARVGRHAAGAVASVAADLLTASDVDDEEEDGAAVGADDGEDGDVDDDDEE